MAASRVRPRAPPRGRAVPVRARDGGRRDAGGGRRPVRRLLVAAAGATRHRAQRRPRRRRRAVSALADPFDGRRAVAGSGLLRAFNDAGVVAAADVHVALRLAALSGDADERVALAAALAVRGPRLGHVYVDLAPIHDTATVESEDEVDLSTLDWPAVDDWLARLSGAPIVAVGEEDDS